MIILDACDVKLESAHFFADKPSEKNSVKRIKKGGLYMGRWRVFMLHSFHLSIIIFVTICIELVYKSGTINTILALKNYQSQSSFDRVFAFCWKLKKKANKGSFLKNIFVDNSNHKVTVALISFSVLTN